MKNIARFLLTASALLLCSCYASHTGGSSIDKGEKLTLGKAQKEVHKGMAQGDVAGSLGSPNIVTRDAEGKETWVYDKIAREVDYSHSDAGVWFLIAGGSKSSGHTASSERTLTVLVKFDDEQRVDNLSYHSSSF